MKKYKQYSVVPNVIRINNIIQDTVKILKNLKNIDEDKKTYILNRLNESERKLNTQTFFSGIISELIPKATSDPDCGYTLIELYIDLSEANLIHEHPDLNAYILNILKSALTESDTRKAMNIYTSRGRRRKSYKDLFYEEEIANSIILHMKSGKTLQSSLDMASDMFHVSESTARRAYLTHKPKK